MSMKYDSNMTQFHDDIVAAIKNMIHGEEDEVAELAAEISPVPLKDYLKDNHGKRFHGSNIFTAMSSCMLVTFDHVINNSGESRLQLSWSQVAAFIRKYPAEIFNKADVKQNKPAELPTVQPERAEEVAERFNYAVLTTELGDYLRHKEEQLRNEYMNFTANCGRIFAEAQEKLAKHGFGENNGVFDKWISSMGFAKPSVYRMISVYNFRSSQIETNEQAQLFDSLSKSLQYEVAKPSAPPELVEQVMNGDITTHKEYIKLKKELEEAEEHNAVLSAEKEQFHSASKANLEKLNEERERSTKLEQRIKELENKPVDVAVDVDELNRRVSAAVSKINSETEHTLAAERREFADTLNAKDDRIWELEDEVKKLKSSPTYTRNEKILAFQMSMDQYKKLLEVVNGSNDKELYKIIQGVKIFG